MEITINIPNLENLASAVNELAKAILSVSPKNLETITFTPEGALELNYNPPAQTAEAAPYVSTIANSAPVQPLQQTSPLTGQIEAQYTQQPAQQPIPTTVPEYTQTQIANACAPLMDAGKADTLRNLLAKYGVQAVTQLPKEAYGAFATDIRALGAKI